MKSLSVEVLKAQRAIKELRDKAFFERLKPLEELSYWYAVSLEDLIVRASWGNIGKRYKVRLFEEVIESAKRRFGLVSEVAQSETKLVAFGG